MDKIKQINYYAVKRDLSIAKYRTLEECVKQEGFLYCIKEIRGECYNQVTPFNQVIFHNPDLEIELLNKDGKTFQLIEKDWQVTGIQIALSKQRWSYSRTLPRMDIADPSGTILSITSDSEYYEGIIELHRHLKFIAKSPTWELANERKSRIDSKVIFIRLKNGHSINHRIYLNPDEDYYVELFFKNGIFIMNSYIIEGEPYLDGVYKNEEQYQSEDFYEFINVVQEKFPSIDIKTR